MEVKSDQSKTIGVLAIQGSFAEHLKMLNTLGVNAIEVRSLADTKNLDGLIIPGGESTVMMQLLKSTGLDQWIKDFATQPKAIRKLSANHSRTIRTSPIYGTCAGMIVLANLGLIDITLDRNAYGPQLYSFEDEVVLSFPRPPLSFPRKRESESRFPIKSGMTWGVFIRAPRVKSFGPKVRVLARHGKDPVLLEQNNILVGSFHPELTENTDVHRYFIARI